MSDEAAQTDENAEASGGKGGGLVGMIITALLAGVFGAVGAVGIQRLAPAPAPVAEAGAPGEAVPEASSAEDYQERMLAFEPIVVNIAGSGSGRFLKVTVAVVTDTVEARDELGMRMPQVKDAMITLMSSKRVVDVADFEGKVLLKEDLRDRIDGILAKGSVEAVLLTEFVVQ